MSGRLGGRGPKSCKTVCRSWVCRKSEGKSVGRWQMQKTPSGSREAGRREMGRKQAHSRWTDGAGLCSKQVGMDEAHRHLVSRGWPLSRWVGRCWRHNTRALGKC